MSPKRCIRVAPRRRILSKKPAAACGFSGGIAEAVQARVSKRVSKRPASSVAVVAVAPAVAPAGAVAPLRARWRHLTPASLVPVVAVAPAVAPAVAAAEPVQPRVSKRVSKRPASSVAMVAVKPAAAAVRVRPNRPPEHRGRSNYHRVTWPERGHHSRRNGLWFCICSNDGLRINMQFEIAEWEDIDNDSERVKAARLEDKKKKEKKQKEEEVRVLGEPI